MSALKCFPFTTNNYSFSDPKPLDKETVSTQSVSHLDADGVVFASFIFFYRSEHQLKKIGLIKPPALPARASSTQNTPAKPKQADFSSLLGSTTGELIPKGDDIYKGRNSFGDFRDSLPQPTKNKSNGKRLNGFSEDDDPLLGDELNRDPRDMAREHMKTEEEVRMEDQLAAQISRVKLKRSHSITSLKSDGPETPPAQPTDTIPSIFSPTAFTPGRLPDKEPETPAKKRKGSGDSDVKSPTAPTRGLNFGGPPERGGHGFGGLLGAPLVAMEEEEL